MIDSAQATEWYNEKAVGRAIRSSNIRRDELFLVSKLHPRHLGYDVTREQFSTSLQDLGTSYLDLFLLHYPRCFSAICSDVIPTGSWQESWKALEELHDELKVRAIGVSNFNKEELQELVAYARIKPSVVQRNSDPFSPDVEIQEYCKQEGIQYMGYSTLGSQWLMRGFSTNPVLNDPLIQGISVAQGCTSAQVVLSWALQKNQVVVPRSSNRLRISENLEAPRCNLNRMQVTRIDDMHRHLPHPSTDVG